MMVAARVAGAGLIGRDEPAGGGVLRRDPAPVTLLVADDLEPRAHQVVHEICAANVATLVMCADGAEALYQIGRLSPDAVVVRARLTLVSAVDVVAAVRRYSTVPIAVGVGAGEVGLATEAMTAGATGVLSRPYGPRQLRTLLDPWLGRARARWDQESVIFLGSLEVDSRAYEVRAGGKPLKFTVREFELLRLLVLHANQVVTRDQIRRAVWRAPGDFASANTIAVHIRRIRARLDGAAELTSVRGVGYRLTLA